MGMDDKQIVPTHLNNSTRFMALCLRNAKLHQQVISLFQNKKNETLTEKQLRQNLFYGPTAKPIASVLQLIHQGAIVESSLDEMRRKIDVYSEKINTIITENGKKEEDDDTKMTEKQQKLLAEYKLNLSTQKKQISTLESTELGNFNQSIAEQMTTILDQALQCQKKIKEFIMEKFDIDPDENEIIINQALCAVLSSSSLYDLLKWSDSVDTSMRGPIEETIKKIEANYEKGKDQDITESDAFYKSLIEIQQKYNQSKVASQKKGMLSSLKGALDLNSTTSGIQSIITSSNAAITALVTDALNQGKTLEQKISLIAKAASDKKMLKSINDLSISEEQVSAIVSDDAKEPDSPQSAALFKR
jgi:hypothetical protein